MWRRVRTAVNLRQKRRCYHGGLEDGTPTGLYGLHHLKTAKGFRRFADEAIEKSTELIAYISGMPSAAEIIRTVDEISDTVCSVVDSAELCRNTHPDREYVQEANDASLRINEYMHHLNTNHTLFNAIKKAELEGNSLTEEARRAAHNLRVDFEKGGIHLSEEKLNRVNQLNVEIAHLCRTFGENIIVDPGYVDVFPRTRIPKHLLYLCKPIYKSTSELSVGSWTGRYSKKEKGYRISTDQSSLSSILQFADDGEVRKMAYIKGNSVPQANLGILHKLIDSRHELAEIMGHKSYAESILKYNMASSPEVLMSFLFEMSGIVRTKADEEFNTIWNFKKEKCGQSCGDLEPWDETYYTALMKSSTCNLNSSAVASYFPLPQCIEGLKILVKSLFGATFCSVPMAPGESWHPDVQKMSLHHPEEGDLGYLYLDLYSREGKYPGCAHFAIKGGRKKSDTEYQSPVVALVCNFSGSSNATVARLNHWELETLFHEFGHALHSLLSRTDYQHFSGTRVALDLAETPSNLFEYYACDFRVLKTFAKHYSSGEIIPEKLVESMQGARKMFAATELQRQILYCLVDQTLFGDEESPRRDSCSVVADLKRRHTSWKHVEGTHWHTRFSHLINYGAGYYSYLYAKCFAATIWDKVCKDDPLSPATGSVLRTRLLHHGGAKEPTNLLNDLVGGGGILKNRDGGIIPDITSLCNEFHPKLIAEEQTKFAL